MREGPRGEGSLFLRSTAYSPNLPSADQLQKVSNESTKHCAKGQQKVSKRSGNIVQKVSNRSTACLRINRELIKVGVEMFLSRTSTMTCWPSLARRLSVMGGSDTRSSAISLVLATCKIPHQEKIHKGGEDAVMYLPALNAFGVADGVGGYADQGVDPGKFSKALMRFSAEEIIGCAKRGEVLPLLQPEKIVRAAFNRIKEHKIEGGSTALICTLVENTLHVSNLGDCSLMIFRCEQNSPTLKLKMRSQTHFFNCPFQLSLTGKDTPEDSLTAKVELEPGDCILAASDGVFDNLFDDDIVQILQQELLKISEVDASESAKSQNVLWSRRTATLIATEALRRAIDSKPTPFEIEATREGFLINGGKLDDISVIFGRVVSREEINLS